jgi:hypothetical protein
VLAEGATSEAGEEAGPLGPRGFLIEASVNIVVKAESVRASAIRPLFCGQGTAPPFIAKEEAVYRRVTLFYLRVMA